METKKSPGADLNKIRGLFFEIGLIGALCLVIGAFAWSQNEKHIEKIDMHISAGFTELPPIAVPEQPTPDPVAKTFAVQAEYFNVVDNNANINVSLNFDEFDEEHIYLPPPINKKEDGVGNDPFLSVEQMPTFEGGDLSKFRSWVMSKLVYPSAAAQNGIDGKVILTFVIETDGSLSNIEILSAPDRTLAEEAERVLKLSPGWTPGKQQNKEVRVRFNLPIDFQLN
ncbi:MAG: energy transducer TonB [Rikenellaceae bacterium]|nr:energy transducer TonB [Rikenellaceae bacterium]